MYHSILHHFPDLQNANEKIRKSILEALNLIYKLHSVIEHKWKVQFIIESNMSLFDLFAIYRSKPKKILVLLSFRIKISISYFCNKRISIIIKCSYFFHMGINGLEKHYCITHCSPKSRYYEDNAIKLSQIYYKWYGFFLFLLG